MVISIDPGLNGAVAVFEDNGVYVGVFDVPTVTVIKSSGKKRREYDIKKLVELLQPYKDSRGMIELVHSMRAQGVSSTFAFGKGYGILLGILGALNINVEQCAPHVWKKRIGIRTGASKSASLALARVLFPTAPLTRAKDDGRADALLMGHYLFRKDKGEFDKKKGRRVKEIGT